ncbi:HNH endonuclease signature motif containing protein [Mycobacterium sp. 852014-52144_SCH5372336]|uniref:HNH endonuclease signature motif containing protein n=1 Tax=Mycobacterium sp. 852014-52144_SCH5372336 TaxID=1834115 RepID=UPI001E369723|nr:HNH endonuclease signature motif containing protein [Mycobacterium sp. 852014-52144_SCH5372336]
MGFERMSEVIAAMAEQLSALVAESFDALSTSEQLALTAQWESFTRGSATVGHRLVAGLGRAPIEELGERSVAGALTVLLRISKAEAHRRVAEAKELAPRQAMTGETLEPVLAHTAAAVDKGLVGAEHVRVIRRFFDQQVPASMPFDVREAAEAQLAQLATKHTPEELRAAAQRLAAYLNPDGDFSDELRAAQRWLRLGRQRLDGMSELRGLLDPATRAALEAVLAVWAAPGRCHPDGDTEGEDGQRCADQDPSAEADPSAETVAADRRTVGQRNHDALNAMCRTLLASGTLGSHNGLPATLLITTTLQELESGTGHGFTGGGSLVPMSEVIRQAAEAHHYLAIFDKATEEPLYLGRANRLASKAQRLVLFARDRGCTRPGCTAPAYHCQVHHGHKDWAVGGQTDIDELTLACGPDNRRVKPGGWRTYKRKDGRTAWRPPPQLDTGQARVNNYHHPNRYLIPDDGDDEGAPEDSGECADDGDDHSDDRDAG